MTGVHAPGPDPAQPKKPETHDKPDDVYGGTWSPPEPPHEESGAGSAPRAPKPKGAPKSEPKSFEADTPRISFVTGSGVSRRASAWWSPPEMGEHF